MNHPTIAVSGASGLIGKEVCSYFSSQGYRIIRMVRHLRNNKKDECYWSYPKQELDSATLSSSEVVIHLAGENIDGTWTPKKKSKIRESRVQGTQFLAEQLSKLSRRPSTFLCASAIGIYGDQGGKTLNDTSSAGTGFLSDVVQEWEQATRPLQEIGMRVVHLRLGVILSLKGGALRKMLPAFRLGIAGKVSHGQQYISWLSLADAVRIIAFIIQTTELSGAINAVSPNPVTNRQLTMMLAKAVNRPAIIPIPACIIKGIFGEMGETTLLASTRALPKVLLKAGYVFEDENLATFLTSEFKP